VVSLPLLDNRVPRSPAARPPAIVERSDPRSVRLSLTDRCDLACVYCRPDRNDGYLDAELRLDLAAWTTMLLGLVQAGVRRVRFTGGEPLLHKDLLPIIEMCARLPLEDLALTTNATRLAQLAPALRKAGLRRITISLDTLDAARFDRMTRGGRLADVLAGIDAACVAGFDEIKLNAVVVRGENDGELEALTRFAWERGIVPRFLEVMAIGEGAHFADRVVTDERMRARVAHLVDDTILPVREANRGPARYLPARHDPSVRVGFISGTSDTYCAGCDRLRVASDGTLRPCLATNDGVPGVAAARSGDAGEVAHEVARAWTMKPDGSTFKGCTEPSAATVSIRAIGG
jgi:cyclic pyranopterin phosphate synthase